MGIKIVYNAVECLAALDNAGIFNGENEGYGWSTHFKRNSTATLTGALHVYANNEVKENINLIYDNDYYDATINDQDVTFGELANVDPC